ncbi:hypothetical protein BD408DRAFT_245838 [Parasitella parasitica]|nr:hypothetical protein BD408DRAFT_245838 [Parasitella parasitica]
MSTLVWHIKTFQSLASIFHLALIFNPITSMIPKAKILFLLKNQNTLNETFSLPGPFTLSIKDINTTGGQCTWCGKYGHQVDDCSFLK